MSPFLEFFEGEFSFVEASVDAQLPDPQLPDPELPDPEPPSPNPQNPARRPLRVLLLGDRLDVLETIKNLHRRGFAPAGEWSRAIAPPQADEVVRQAIVSLPTGSVISILTKYMSDS
jgi:hypothetical protein